MRVLRTLKGVSQEALAREVGKSTPTIAQIERGALEPSLDLKRGLAAAFDNVPSSLLLTPVPAEIVEEAALLMVERLRAARASVRQTTSTPETQ